MSDVKTICPLAVGGARGCGSGGTLLPRSLVESLCRHKKPQFLSLFLSLLILALLVLCSMLSSSTLSHWDGFPLHKYYHRFPNQTNRFKPPPPYSFHPKHKVKPTGTSKTTQDSTALTTVSQSYLRNYHFIMDNQEVCQTETPFLVLMVPVAPKNLAARDAIRQTWGKESMVKGQAVLTLFMLGLSGGADVQEELRQENLQHRDLLQSNFADTYLNLTLKTMVIMDWLATRCPTAAYAMKVDSDMFLNVDNLVVMLQKPGIPKVDYLTGMLMWNRPVIRSKDSKWYVPLEMYPDPVYPTYALGMGYVFSNDLPKKFVEVSKSIRPFNIEDAYIGLCMKKLGLALTSPPDPPQFRAYNQRYDRCPRCAEQPPQVHLMSAVARWNTNGISDAVFGLRGRNHRTASTPAAGFGLERLDEDVRGHANVPLTSCCGWNTRSGRARVRTLLSKGHRQ
uniref:Hexosyltransferase n=1 Tax=Gasterosteus aculeatus aculeatus TaxID=481459 RepID=A0AAQ4P9K0_GASAC